MESLIAQFAALKTQMLAFESALNNMIPPTAPDPNNIIEMYQPQAYRAGYIRGQDYLARVIADTEAKRAADRKRPLSMFAQACAEVRAAHPTLSKDEVYLQARMRLRLKSNSLEALNN